MEPTIKPIGALGIDNAIFTYPYTTKRKCALEKCRKRAEFRGYNYCLGTNGKDKAERHARCKWPGKLKGKLGEHVSYWDMCDVHFAEGFLGLYPIPCKRCLGKIRKVNKALPKNRRIDEAVGLTFISSDAAFQTRRDGYVKKSDKRKNPTRWALPMYNIYCFHCGRVIMSNSTKGYRKIESDGGD